MQIRNPLYTRPWQHVFDCLYGYIEVAKYLNNNPYSDYYSFNIGPNSDSIVTVEELMKNFASYWDLENKPEIVLSNENSSCKSPKESKFLKLDCSLVNSVIGWTPKLDLETSVKMTCSWYLKFIEDQSRIFNYSKEIAEEFLNNL